MEWRPEWGERPERVPNAAHPSAEHRNLHPVDLRLRQFGFKIRRRPKDGGAVWCLGEQEFTADEALEWCRSVQKKKRTGRRE
jgi:hypothetical protein